jgi:hypothetical protein
LAILPLWLSGGHCVASPLLGSSASLPAINAAIFQQDRFVARQKIFAFHPQFRFCDANGNTLAFLELLTIKARKIIDWGSSFDVTDSINHQRVGALKRRGWKSLVRSEWLIVDANDQEIGRIVEQSALMAVLRRFLSNLLSQTYIFEIRGQQVGMAKQRLNFLVPRMEADFSADPGRTLDRRLATAAIVLLMSVEGRQSA